MEQKNMTALVSCFARAYHSINYKHKIFDDNLAHIILSQDEYDTISLNMKKGINFFNPKFKGSDEEALRYIVDNQLSPSVLGRSAFAEEQLENNLKLGITQYLILAAGYDTYAYRNNNDLKVFEIDKKEMIEDKHKRLNLAQINYSKVNYICCDFVSKNWIDNIINSNYNKTELTFCSLLGISYYLTKQEFNELLKEISKILSKGSFVVFDYPTYNETKKEITNQKLAKEANEEMKSKYSIEDIKKILKDNGFLINKNLVPNDITNNYFYNYNIMNPDNKIIAPNGVNYCLAIKK